MVLKGVLKSYLAVFDKLSEIWENPGVIDAILEGVPVPARQSRAVLANTGVFGR